MTRCTRPSTSRAWSSSTTPPRRTSSWQVREAGLGATAHVPAERDTFEGWEDSAVAPERLGDYLRDLQGLYDEFGYSDDLMPSLYGHFGQGCVHTRIPFGLYRTEGVARYRRFTERAADLVIAYGGSLSGEHGDGQARCKTDCPANVDMATYKAEFLAQHYRGRPWARPRSDLALGRLPAAARLASSLRLTGAVNAVTHTPVVRRFVALAGGFEPRETPLFAGESLQQWHSRHRAAGGPGAGRYGTVLLWPDTFTNYFHPHVGQAAVQVLEAAGWAVEIPAEPLCCGLTWISTGQLRTASRLLSRTVTRLAEHVRAGGFVVGLEPSCTTVFRSDASDLFPDDQDVLRLRDHTVTLAELLTQHTPDWKPPKVGREVLAQVHCHQHAVLHFDADKKLLADAGAQAEPLESGCCGLAGNFGFEAGHGDVSRALAERVLLPRLRQAAPGAVVLADGFSCRTQIHELDSGGREAMHLAELLAAAAGHRGVLGLDRELPERRAALRPAGPRAAAKLAVAGATAALAAALVTGAAGAVRRRVG